MWDKADQVLNVIYEDGPSADWPPRDQLIAVFVSVYQIDVMALWMGGPLTDGAHPVQWFGGEILDTCPNVHGWWLAMTSLAKRRVAIEAAEQGVQLRPDRAREITVAAARSLVGSSGTGRAQRIGLVVPATEVAITRAAILRAAAESGPGVAGMSAAR